MDFELSGRRALVTGGSSGIGRGIVDALAGEGATVLLCGRSREAGEAVVAQLAAKGGKAQFLVADMTNDASMDALAAAIAADGGIDILVNNVGGANDPDAGSRSFFDIPPEDWQGTYQKCVFNAVRLTRLLVPPMRDRGWGRVVNISSTAGLEPGMSPADYSSAKAALNSATLSLASSLSRTGVTANVVAPGPILTDALHAFIDFVGNQSGWPEDPAVREQKFITEVMPLKATRMGRPEDIGAMVAFLCSGKADYVTGSLIRVDGGLSAAAI